MAKKVKGVVKEAVLTSYPDYSLSNTDAPQGSNTFSDNIRIERDGNSYLVKAIHLNKLSQDTLEQTISLVEASTSLRSPFFVQLIDSIRTEQYFFLRYPFLQGQTLSELMSQQNSFTEDELRELAIALLRGISDYARHGVVHQDIKPDNIFVTDTGDIKILDFGSARFGKSCFRGSARTNRHYSAPEQLYATKPVHLEQLRLTVDERSDIYSVGVILYELCTGSLPFTDNNDKLTRKIPSIITRDDLSEGFKNIVFRLLNEHIRNRPLSATEAISFFERNQMTPIEVERGGFYYSVSTSIARFQLASQLDESLFNGVIARASRVPRSEIPYLSNGPFTTIIDPDTYLFQAKNHINKKFKELPYYHYGLSADGEIGIEHLTDDRLPQLILDTIKYEITVGADVVIPPFFIIKETNDLSWTLDQRINELTPGIYKNQMIQLPLFKGVSVSSTVLTTDTTRGRVLDYLTSPTLNNYSGFYVLFENDSQSEALTSGAWLLAARDFLRQLLATGKTVIWGQCSLAGIVMASQPGLSIALGENQSQRNVFFPEQKTRGGASSPHIYAPDIFARVKWPVEQMLRDSDQGSNFVCLESCCRGVDFNNQTRREESDLATHFIFRLAQQFKKYSEGGVELARNDIEIAQSVYNMLKNSDDILLRRAVANEIKPDTTTFLEIWLDALR